MLYEMHLSPTPFNKIATERKTVEMRLFTESRKHLTAGDTIEFTNNVTGKKITVEVTGVHQFKNFKELYEFYPKEKLGYNSDEIADYKDMNIYYTDENIKNFGVIGIEIKLIKEKKEIWKMVQNYFTHSDLCSTL